MKTILVPTDFSAQSTCALNFALALAKMIPAKIVVLHVIKYPIREYIEFYGELASLEDEFVRLLDKHVDEKMEDFLGKNADKVEIVIQPGNTAWIIEQYTKANDIDYIIMGSKGISGVEHLIVGSNTEKVVRRVKCPVITVKEDVDPKNIKKLVFGTDFKDTSQELIDHLKEVQELFGATIHLVKINTPNTFARNEEVRRDIDAFIRKYDFDNYEISIYNDINEEEGIIAYSLDKKADMIAIGTHGYRGLKHFYRGSIAEQVVNHAHIPIWTYHFMVPEKESKNSVIA